MKYNNGQLNKLALEVKQLMEQDIEQARNSMEYYNLMEVFFGYNGGEGNLIQKLTEDIWRYETIEQGRVSRDEWKVIEEAIKDYDVEKGNFLKFSVKNLLCHFSKRVSEAGVSKLPPSYEYVDSYDNIPDSTFDPYQTIDENDGVKEICQGILSEVRGNKEKKKFILDYMMKAYVGLDVDGLELTKEEKGRADKSVKFNATECAKLMVDKFGGTFEANERFVNRFRNKCAEFLENKGYRLNTTYKEGQEIKGIPMEKEPFWVEVAAEDIKEIFDRNEDEELDMIWAKNIYKKFNYKCIVCGSHKKPNAHHLYGKARYPEFHRNENNGVVLCEECHVTGKHAFHKQEGCKPAQHITGEKFIEWLKTRNVDDEVLNQVKKQVEQIRKEMSM